MYNFKGTNMRNSWLLLVAFSMSTALALDLLPAKVSFKNLKDGARLTSPFKVEMKVEGMALSPAGKAPDDKHSGHHHLIVDGKAMALGEVIPSDETHLHFGKGQTETDLKLSPGPHTLTLQFADGAHRSFGPELSTTIKIVVK